MKGTKWKQLLKERKKERKKERRFKKQSLKIKSTESIWRQRRKIVLK